MANFFSTRATKGLLKVGEIYCPKNGDFPSFSEAAGTPYLNNLAANVPERFEGKNNALFNSEAYYPFGGGPRMCIGFYFATMEITIVLAQLLFHFDFELDETHKVEFEPLVTLKHPNR